MRTSRTIRSGGWVRPSIVTILFSSTLYPNSVLAQTTLRSPEDHEQRAHQFLTEKKPELAIPEFRAVLAADPGNLDAQANLGVLLYFRGDYAGAAPLLKQAVAQKPDLSKIRASSRPCQGAEGSLDKEPRLAWTSEARRAGRLACRRPAASRLAWL